MKFLLTFIILVGIHSCNTNNVGNDYYYLTIYKAMDVGYPYGSIVYKSKKENSFDKIIIYSDVISCVSNNKYFLVYQEPNKNLFNKFLTDELNFWNSYFIASKKDSSIEFAYHTFSLKSINSLIEKFNNQTEKIADSLIKNDHYYQKCFSNKFNYWIINTHADMLMGPFTKDEYLAKRKELYIPNNLELRFSAAAGK